MLPPGRPAGAPPTEATPHGSTAPMAPPPLLPNSTPAQAPVYQTPMQMQYPTTPTTGMPMFRAPAPLVPIMEVPTPIPAARPVAVPYGAQMPVAPAPWPVPGAQPVPLQHVRVRSAGQADVDMVLAGSQLGSRPARLAARMIDEILIRFKVIVIAATIDGAIWFYGTLARRLLLRVLSGSHSVGTLAAFAGGWLIAILIGVVFWYVGYPLLSYRHHVTRAARNDGRTTGKRVMGLQVIQLSTGRVAGRSALRRRWWADWGGMSIAAAIPGLDLIVWCYQLVDGIVGLADRNCRSLHDRFGGTAVIRAEELDESKEHGQPPAPLHQIEPPLTPPWETTGRADQAPSPVGLTANWPSPIPPHPNSSVGYPTFHERRPW